MFKWLFKAHKKTAPEPLVSAASEASNASGVGAPSFIHRALQHHQAGRFAEADAAYRQVLAADPDNFDALHLSGVVAFQTGQHDAAAERIAQALSRNPSNAAAQNNLGAVFRAQARLDEALECFRNAVVLHPDYVDAHTNLGAVLMAQGKLDEAAACYEKLVSLTPDSPGAHLNLGNVRSGQGNWAAAFHCYTRALALKPDSFEAQFNLGNVFKDTGRLDEAIDAYRKALDLKPDFPEAHFSLGHAFWDQGRTDEAIRCYRKTLSLKPDFPEAHFSLGQVFNAEGNMAEAVGCYQKALGLSPGYVEARWALAMSQLPAIYEIDADTGRSRTAFSGELAELEPWFEQGRVAEGFRAVGVLQPFLLAYQEEHNRELLRRYGDLCARLMSNWFQRQGFSQQKRGQHNGTIRVGIVSQHFHNHSVWNAIVKGWFQQLDRRRFSLHAFYLGTRQDQQTLFAKSNATHFEEGRRELRQWTEAIIDQEIDALIYPEIGMDPMTVKLASLRLAPVQIASWGHPETTGLPTIDHYLSAEDLEPPLAQDNYTERLVTLPNLGCFYRPLPVAATSADLRGLGIDPEQPVLLCPGVPFKYAPSHDRVLTEIAQRLGRCRFVFFTHRLANLSEKLRHRLDIVFSRSNLNSGEFVTFVPWQDSPGFYGWLKRADVFLDTIGFSGFNTAMQGVECGVPIVTREGRFMRGRLASGILKRVGLQELVTKTEEDYIALAVNIAKDRAYRRHISERIAASRHILFEDLAPVRALEGFLAEVNRHGTHSGS